MVRFEQLFEALRSVPGREATLRQARNPLVFDAKIVGRARPSLAVVAGPISRNRLALLGRLSLWADDNPCPLYSSHGGQGESFLTVGTVVGHRRVELLPATTPEQCWSAIDAFHEVLWNRMVEGVRSALTADRAGWLSRLNDAAVELAPQLATGPRLNDVRCPGPDAYAGDERSAGLIYRALLAAGPALAEGLHASPEEAQILARSHDEVRREMRRAYS